MPLLKAGWGLGVPFNIGMGGTGCLEEAWTGFTEVRFDSEGDTGKGAYQH